MAGRRLSEWIADLNSTDALVREEAVDVLQEFGAEAKAAVPRLSQLYQTDVPAVRRRAALALWRIDRQVGPANEVLTEMLRFDTAGRRVRAAQLLLLMGRPAAELVGPLVDLLREGGDMSVSMQITSAIAMLGDAAVPALRNALRDARGDHRIQLMTAVASLGSTARELLPELQSLRKDADPRTRFMALRIVHQLAPKDETVFADLVAAGNSTDQGMRREALQATQSLTSRSKALAPLFRGFLRDSDTMTRCRAAASLYLCDRSTLAETLPIIRKVIQDETNPNWSQAVMFLSAFGPDAKDAIPDLEAMLKQPNGRNYSYAVTYVCRSMGPDSVPLLVDMLEDPQNYYRTLNQQTLTDLGPAAMPQLLRALPQKSPMAKQAALDAIQRFGPGMQKDAAAIAKYLADADASVRDRALAVLENLGPDAADSIASLVEALRDPKIDDAKRLRVIALLGRIGPAAKETLPEIEKHVSDTKPSVRCRALLAVMCINRERRGELLPRLQKAIEESLPAELPYSSLIEGLANLKLPAADTTSTLSLLVRKSTPKEWLTVSDALSKHMSDRTEVEQVWYDIWKNGTHHPARLEAAIALSKRKLYGKEMAPFLREQIDSAATGQHEGLLTALSEYGSESNLALPKLVERWRSATSYDARIRITQCILKIDPVHPIVLPWIRDQFRMNLAVVQRHLAARVLCQVDPAYPELRPVLEKWSRETNVITASAGLEMLGLLGEHARPSVAFLRTVMQSADPRIRVRAAFSIWQIEKKPAEVLPILIDCLKSTDPTTTAFQIGYVQPARNTAAVAAAEALGQIGVDAKPANAALQSALLAADQQLRQSAATALRKIEGTR
jgi:hypothetical protein